MAESEKKVLGNEELEDVNGGTIIDDVMDTMDVMEELGDGLDMSVGSLSGEGEYYIRNSKTGEMYGPYSLLQAEQRMKKWWGKVTPDCSIVRKPNGGIF